MPIHGSTQVLGDDWMWLFKLSDTELTGAALILTAKQCVDDVDPGDFQLSSSVTTEIEILSGSTANRLDAIIRVPSDITEDIRIPFNADLAVLSFDVQLIRSGTPTTAPKIETFFRHMNAFFKVIKDITKLKTAPVVTP